ncbi:asparagine--tRNA ligase [Parachlamydia sp. AcF125]|uniref:asparagine--tRNA ligase n=1 Tax=Parachlamydia sp. AcF125 TaxID=2795736 RepID=UPI001BD8BF8F|nr:asparagine--tRNA ligase [Parachlamydia sp. AcF125]MBS4169284.1 Asparagine--tRNA ligase [Parachlamydia sp. AcF125]
MRIKIKQLKNPPPDKPSPIGSEVMLKGWVRTVRNQKTFTFIEINDGSTLSNFQVIANPDLPNYEKTIQELSTGASVAIQGTVVESPGKNQSLELVAKEIRMMGSCDPETYPLQKKRHSYEFLRTIAHLRPRTNTLGAVARIRNALSFATHLFFQTKGFLYVHTPIITSSDCEGAGKMFRVTTLDPDSLPKTKEGKVDYSRDFFEKPTYLTVSGQLEGEIYACALSDIYTFGPTFRAENSNTSRHLAEFWMIEPEMAFADINDDMDCAEQYLKYTIQHVLEHCQEDIDFFNQYVSSGLRERLEHIVNTPFERASYSYAIRILEKANKPFEYPVKWGADLQSEHERFLAEEYFSKPVILTDYPKEIKSFYMRLNDDEKTVAAMDVLVPRIGEIIGGSQREDRLDYLKQRLIENNLKEEDYWWYLELRKYGSVPHAGFGLGFERLVQFVTGIENIRDAIPFPRFPGKAEF